MFGSKNTAKNGQAAADAKSNAPKPAATGSSSRTAEVPKAPAAGGALGASPISEAPAASAETQRRAGQVIRQALAFTQVVTVLMRSPHYKHFTLTDLEWLVLPPILAGQYSVAEVRKGNDAPAVPAAVALWASVSPEVDKRLRENPGAPIRLRPEEWRSGEVLWLIAVVGDRRVVPQVLKSLGETRFKGREVRARGRGQDGKPKVTVVSASEDGAAFARALLAPPAPG